MSSSTNRVRKPERKGRANPRLAKIHRSYTVEEAAKLFDVHRNTVRHWIKQGLPTNDGKRPTLILGGDLRAFLHFRRVKRKRPCKPGEIYCVRCRVPRRPAGAMADYQPSSVLLGNLIGICPSCDGLMYRSVNIEKIDQVRGDVEVTILAAQLRINEIKPPTVNSDFTRDTASDDEAQPRKRTN